MTTETPNERDGNVTDDLRELLAKASARPWSYRPNKFDDWGWIRDANGDLAAKATCQITNWDARDHRSRGADPFGHNAQLIVAAVNALPAPLDRLDAAERERDEATRALSPTKGE